MTSELGVIEGPRARWVNSDSPFAELPRDYPKPKCPRCGSEEYQMCTNWTPLPGLDPGMKMVRCAGMVRPCFLTEFDKWLMGEFCKYYFDCRHRVSEKCNTEYYLAPMLKNNTRGVVV